MNLNDYQNGCMNTAKGTRQERAVNFALSLGGEVGELIEATKMYMLGMAEAAGKFQNAVKKVAYHSKPLNKELILSELGDVLWYVSACAEAYGFTLQEVAEYNLKKLQEREAKKKEENKQLELNFNP